MAYGRGRKDTMKRTVEAGRLALSDPHHPLRRIRAEVRTLAEEMAIAAWSEDPADPLPEGKELYAVLSPLQKASTLNAVWAEAARLLESSALEEAHARRARHLFGVLKNLDRTDKAGVLVNVPERMRDALDRNALRAFAHRLEGTDWEGLMALASAAFRRKPDTGLDPVQTDLVRGACEAANAKFRRPTWCGPRADRAVVRLNLDARSVRGAARALTDHLDLLNAAAAHGITGITTVLISGPEPRQDAIVLPVRLRPHLSGRYGAGAFVGSLCVEVGADVAVIKAVMEKRKAAAPNRVRFVMGWDFGYRNTLASALIDLGREVSLAEARRLLAATNPEESAACRAHLTGNVLPDGVRIVRVRTYDGSGFMTRMNALGSRIDALNAEIDRVYLRLRRLKAEFRSGAGMGPEDLVPEACPDGLSALTAKHHRRFWRAYAAVAGLKTKRRRLYRQADGVKRSWFGFVLNREMAVAARHGAVVTAEDLSVEAETRDSPQYKGKAFNTMINHGAKGRFARAADAKAQESGVEKLNVPSRHTSTTDARCGVVDAAQRRGDAFTAKADGRVSHADAHAAFTIAVWPFLVPKTEDSVRKALGTPLDALAA